MQATATASEQSWPNGSSARQSNSIKVALTCWNVAFVLSVLCLSASSFTNSSSIHTIPVKASADRAAS